MNCVCILDICLTSHAADWEAIEGLLARSSLVDRFTDAVFDYVCLLDLDYKKLFRCQCSDNIRDPDHMLFTYDNSCKLLEWILNRWPEFAENVEPVIDALHHSGHVNCSPFYHSKKNMITKTLNSALNEQKNRHIQRLASTVAHMGQIRVMVYLRSVSCVCLSFMCMPT